MISWGSTRKNTSWTSASPNRACPCSEASHCTAADQAGSLSTAIRSPAAAAGAGWGSSCFGGSCTGLSGCLAQETAAPRSKAHTSAAQSNLVSFFISYLLCSFVYGLADDCCMIISPSRSPSIYLYLCLYPNYRLFCQSCQAKRDYFSQKLCSFSTSVYTTRSTPCVSSTAAFFLPPACKSVRIAVQ